MPDKSAGILIFSSMSIMGKIVRFELWFFNAKISFSLLICLAAYHFSNAQVSNYIFSQSTGTYLPEAPSGTPANVFSNTWDDNSTIYPIPFNFSYNGVTYTTSGTIGVDTDAWLAFSNGTITMTGNLSGGSWTALGANTGMYLYGNANNNGFAGINCDWNSQNFATITASTTINSDQLTVVSSMSNIQIGTRLNGSGIPTGTVVKSFTGNTITMSTNATSTISGVTVTPSSSIYSFVRGTAPNRQFVVQWTQVKRYSGGINDNFNFQMILNEGGGNPVLQTLQTVYGPCSTSATATIDCQVGLRGTSSSDFNSRRSFTGWANTVIGTSSTDSVRITSSLLPSNGLTFTWALCTAPPASAGTITGSVAVCPNTTVNYSLSAVTGATSYNWSYSGTGATFAANTTFASNNISFALGSTAGILTVTPANTCGTGSSSTLGIAVNSLPAATISYGSSVLCSGSGNKSVSQTGPSGGTYTITSGGVTINASTGQINLPAGITGLFTVTYAYTFGTCSGTATNSFNVIANPVVNTSATPALVCSGSSQLLASAASNYTVSTLTYTNVTPATSATTIWNTYADDQVSSAINLPFTFNFYGQAITQVYANSNGYITLQNNNSSSVAQTLPSTSTPNNVIALAWRDLIIDPSVNSGANVRYFTNGSAPNRIFIMEFSKLIFFSNNSGDVSGQIRLYESDNHIEIAAVNVNDNGANLSKTMGIENSTGTSGIAAPARNNVVWNTALEAWGFYPSSFSYAWTPSTYLNSTTISNPLASGVASSVNYSVTVTETVSGCFTTASVPITFSTPLAGTYTVGAGGNFTTITAAINAYNTQCIGGSVTFSLVDNAYNTGETFPINILSNNYTNSTNTLTIKPAAGINPTITGTSSIAIFRLNGADYVTIDGSNTTGGTTRNLTIVNNSTNSTTSTIIWLYSNNSTNGATNNKIINCALKGNAPTTTYTALMCSGSFVGDIAEAANANNTFSNNTIKSAQSGIVLVGPTGNETGNVISNNVIGSTVNSEKLSWSGIELYQQAGAEVFNNTIFGITTGTSTTTVGIAVYGTMAGANIHKNKIYNIKNTNTLGYGANGIYLGASNSAANINVYNNFVSDVTGYGYTSRFFDENGYGIVCDEGGGYNIYFNTVALNTNQTDVGFPSAYLQTANTIGTINLRNNIFSNTQTQSGKHYAIMSLAPNSVFSSINYNNYYVASGDLAYISSDRTTIANLTTGFGGNANSVNILPVFTSTTDLHIVPASNASLSNLATPVSGFNEDVDGNTRNGTNPDLGADEWVKPNTGSWVGKNSVSWTNPLNWEDNVVPNQTTDIQVNGGYAFLPTITSVQAVRDINMSSPALITISNGQLQLYGNVTNSGGFFTATQGVIETKRTGAAQTISGSWFTGRNLSTLINSNSTGTIINNSANDTLRILSAVLYGNVSNSAISTNNNLTLVSSDTATARLGKITSGNSINGNVTVERYIPVHTKAWQFLSTPTTGQTIKQAWQEGSSSPNTNSKPGYGTQIASNVANATSHPTPGFDAIGTAPGIKTFNSSTNQWVGVASTALPVVNNKGYMLFVRGDRSATLFNSAATALKLRTTGLLFSPANVPAVTSVNAGKFESVGNPYPSAINFDSVVLTGGVQRNFYVWDPKLTNATYSIYGFGAFQTFSSNSPAPGYTVVPGSGSYTNGNTNIESGQAFLVYAPFSAGTVSFSENAKATGSNVVTRVNVALQQLRINLTVDVNNEKVLLDGTVAQFNDHYSNQVDTRDAFKTGNFAENISLSRNRQILAIERRSLITNSDTLFLNISGLKKQRYYFDFEPQNWTQLITEAYLEDNYTTSRTSISISSEFRTSFIVDDHPSSYAADRFRIVFKSAPKPFSFTSVSGIRNTNRSVKLNWLVNNELSIEGYDVERSANGIRFNKIGETLPELNNSGNTSYTFIEQQAPINTIFYRIKAKSVSGIFQYSDTILLNNIKNKNVSLVSNPVKDQFIQLTVVQLKEGWYTFSLFNEAGQLISEEQKYISENDNLISLPVKNIVKGMYVLRMTSNNFQETMQVIIE